MFKKRFFAFVVFMFIAASIIYGSNPYNGNMFYLSLPDISWALAINREGFKIEDFELRPDGKSRKVFAVNEKTGMVISVYIEPAAQKGDSRQCRDYYWSQAKKSPFKKEKIKMREQGQISMVEYLVKEYKNQTINQKNINAYLAKDDIWIDVHISKTDFKKGDAELFDIILKSITFKEDYAPDRFDYFEYGSIFFIDKNYKKAIVYYDKLLELEKQEPIMEKTGWRLAVDNLGMAYGISGNLMKSKEIFEYGISNDPEYPLFYYNLACAYGEMNDMENAMMNMEKAYKYKQNIIKGEEFPDPKTDSSFKQFINDEKFLKFLEKMNK